MDVLPTPPSSGRICIAFRITISQFFEDYSNEVTLINSRQKKGLISNAGRPRDNEQYDALINFLSKL